MSVATRSRADFRVEPQLFRRSLIDNGYVELPITGQHAIATEHLPPLHSDPFDRLIVAQAQTEGGLLVTSDEVVSRYPGPVRRV